MFISKQITSLAKRVSQFTLIALCFSCVPAFASICVEDDDLDHYGNATICPFKTAIEGTDALDPQDRAYMEGLDQTRIINRTYVRLLVGNPRTHIKDIEGSVILVEGADPLAFPVTRFEDSLLHVLAAWGHYWENWALEGELLFARPLKQNVNPIGIGLPMAAFFEVKQIALFFNAQYILPHVVSFYPSRLQIHLDAGFGPAYKRAETTTSFVDGTPGQTDSKSHVSLAGNLGCGLRYQITPHILVDVAYRYFHLGSVKFEPVQGLAVEADLMKTTGLFFGGTYQF